MLTHCRLPECQFVVPTPQGPQERLALHPPATETTEFSENRNCPRNTSRWHNPDRKEFPALPSQESNPSWVHDKLRRRVLQPTEKLVDGELGVEKQGKETLDKAQQEEKQQQEMFIANDGQHVKSYNITLVTSLKACAKQKDLQRGISIHADIVRRGLLETNVFVGSSLVNLYVKCGTLEKAQHVFNEILVRDAISWNALLAGYAQHERGEEALDCFEQMQLEGFSPTAVSFACALKACSTIEALDKGQELHVETVKECLLEEHTVVANALVDMYAKCGALLESQEVFDELQDRDVVSWNALIAGYAQHELDEEALTCFEQMQIAGFPPDAVTFPSILKACGSLGALDKGKEIHTQIVKRRLVERDIHIGTALVDMYAKCGALEKAQEVFDELSVQDAILWNALITGYAQHQHGQEAIRCFKRMQLEGFPPSTVTFACILKACGSIEAINYGQEIHAQIVRECVLENDIHVSTALIDMYAKCGALEEAQDVFDKLQVWNVASWNALIGGYVQCGFGEKALICFQRMHHEGFSPDTITFACILKACGSTGTACKGQVLHSQIITCGFLENGMVVGNALVDMYANCGMLSEAQEMFDKLPVRDVVSWSALMVGFSQLGKDDVVFHLFDRMIADGTEPDVVTFTIVLNTCSHKGLPDKGKMFFEMISKVYGIIPTLEHHVCMIDLLGRMGHLEMAVAVMEEMPFSANVTVWHTLLSACRICRNMMLARWAFEYAVQSHEEVDAAYVCMSDIFAAAGMQEDVMRIEGLKI